ncbi:MAG: hypothetical protein JKY56_10395 [Kofleriaceae bacterium]|nr:hypothetical protein [Kofleriaceae bacterium]
MRSIVGTRKLLRTRKNLLIFLSLSFPIMAATACRSAPTPIKGKTTPQKQVVQEKNQTPMNSDTTQKKTDNKRFLEAIKSGDTRILNEAGQASSSIVAEIDEAFSAYSQESKVLAVNFIVENDSKESGEFLLKIVTDTSAELSQAAAEGLMHLSVLPPADIFLRRTQAVDDPYNRALLYRAFGNRQGPTLLKQARLLLETESKSRLAILAACAKLGGEKEQEEILTLLRKANPEDAEEMQELLVYVAKARLLKGLLPWFEKNGNVIQLGSVRHHHGYYAQMPDYAIWTAVLLKVPFPFTTIRLRKFSKEERNLAKNILGKL